MIAIVGGKNPDEKLSRKMSLRLQAKASLARLWYYLEPWAPLPSPQRPMLWQGLVLWILIVVPATVLVLGAVKLVLSAFAN